MRIVYQASLEDLAEPAIRHFLRSKTARTARVKSALVGAILWAATWVFIFRDHLAEIGVGAALLGAVCGAALNFLTYVPRVKRGVRKHLRNQHGSQIPAETIFVVAGDRLTCECLGVKVELALRDLAAVSEDRERLELSFGEKGLCTIPLRAFRDEAEKTQFLHEVTAGRAAGASGEPG